MNEELSSKIFLRRLSEKKEEKGWALLLGGFDGLHRGHETLLSAAKATGLCVATLAIEGGKGEPLYTPTERDGLFSRAGIDAVCDLRFLEIKDFSAKEFALAIREKISPKVCFCGEDFRFGKGGIFGGAYFEEATEIPVRARPVLKDSHGEKIGTEHVKKLLSAGKVEQANAWLTEPFFLEGEVKADRGIGRTISFPTANIEYPAGKFKIKQGVYETSVEIDGWEYAAITNFGARPTFQNGTVVTETHLIGFDGDLYSRRLHVRFLRFLREIEAFSSVEALKKQLKEDERRVKDGD